MSASSTFLQGLETQAREKRGLETAHRSDLIQQYTTLRDQAQKVLSSGQALDKATGNMRPLTDQEKQQLSETTAHLNNYIQRLYNPNVSPDTGALSEDPIHKLTDKLHLTRAPKGAPAGESAQDIQKTATEFQGEFGAPTEAAEARQNKERDVSQFRDLAKKYGMPEQAITDITARMLGGSGAATRNKWDTLQGTVDGKPVTYMKNQATGEITDLAGNEVPSDTLSRFQMAPKKAPTRLDTSKEAYGDSFDPPVTWEQMTPAQRAFFPRWEAMQKESLTRGEHVVLKQNENLQWVPVTVPTESERSFPANAPGVPPVPEGLRKGGAAPRAAGASERPSGEPGGKATPTSKTPPSTPKKGAGGVSVGAPLFRGVDKNLVRDVGDYRTAVSRAQTMHQNLEDIKQAKKEGRTDQQAQLSLLFNHIGMTSGAQKGTRITQTMIDEAQESAPFVARLLARIGVGNNLDEMALRGVVLTDEQMDSMVKLADEKVHTLARQVQEEEKSFFPSELQEGATPGATGDKDIDDIVRGLRKKSGGSKP